MKYTFYNNILLLKSVLYRIISITIFSILFGTKLALLAGTVAFIIYITYDYIFSHIFKIRAENKGMVVWFTGLPCSGKSTIADEVAKILHARGFKIERLDGDVVRYGHLSDDLGFSKKDRDKNIKRVTFVSKVLSRNGVIVLASFVSPYRKARQTIKESVTNFIEVYVKASAKECAKRDIKGMWKLAKKGKIKGFTGYDAPYEQPYKGDIVINTEKETIKESSMHVINELKQRRLI